MSTLNGGPGIVKDSLVIGSRQTNIIPSATVSNYLNSWHYWSFVIIQSTFQVKVYVDSVLIVTFQCVDWGTIAQNGSTAISIGSYLSGTLFFYNGSIANMQVYNKALIDTEVNQNYIALKGRFGL